MQRAGGYEHQSIAYGNWSWLKRWDQGDYATWCYLGKALQCDYHYRNTPTAPAWYSILCANLYPGEDIPTTDHLVMEGARRTGPVRFWLGYTKPRVKTACGCPPFKTAKLLRGRAIVSDTFTWHNLDCRATDGTYNTIGPNEPGYGKYGHRDGRTSAYGGLER